MTDARLVTAAPSLRSFGLAMLAAAAFATVVVLVVFDWPVREVIYGGLLGTVIFGAATWLGEVRHEVPRAEALPAAPAGEPILRWPRPWARLLLVVPLVVGVGLAVVRS